MPVDTNRLATDQPRDIAGLISLRAGALRNLRIPDSVSCLHELLVDLSLQLLAREARAGHCHHQLLVRDPQRNPTVLAVASPTERQLFSSEQLPPHRPDHP